MSLTDTHHTPSSAYRANNQAGDDYQDSEDMRSMTSSPPPVSELGDGEEGSDCEYEDNSDSDSNSNSNSSSSSSTTRSQSHTLYSMSRTSTHVSFSLKQTPHRKAGRSYSYNYSHYDDGSSQTLVSDSGDDADEDCIIMDDDDGDSGMNMVLDPPGTPPCMYQEPKNEWEEMQNEVLRNGIVYDDEGRMRCRTPEYQSW